MLGRPSQEPGRNVQEAPRLRTTPRRVLVAEDNIVNQRVAAAILEKAGHTVTIAADGREALRALERETFDVVLMDVQMPGMSGPEATAAIRARERTHGGHLPIIALTAHAMAGDRERCLAEGADGYVAKPIIIAELFREIDVVLGGVPAASPAEQPDTPFDADALRARTGGDDALMKEVVGLFLEDCPDRLDAIRQALEVGDTTGVHRSVHTLKGSAGNFGAPSVIAVAKRLEALAGEGNLEACRKAFPELEDRVRELTNALAAELKSSRAS